MGLFGHMFGEEHLKNKGDPFTDENCRVQIVNTGGADVEEGKSAPAPHSEALPSETAGFPGGRRHPFQCRAQISVNRRLAVAMSIRILPLSRSIRSRLPSSCNPRRPMSIASMREAGAVLIAW